METIMTEAIKIFLESLKRQSFSVILTLAGILALGWWNLRLESNCQSDIAALQIKADSCAAQRVILSMEVARLRERINVLAETSVRKK
jgi:hypothetical protein